MLSQSFSKKIFFLLFLVPSTSYMRASQPQQADLNNFANLLAMLSQMGQQNQNNNNGGGNNNPRNNFLMGMLPPAEELGRYLEPIMSNLGQSLMQGVANSGAAESIASNFMNGLMSAGSAGDIAGNIMNSIKGAFSSQEIADGFNKVIREGFRGGFKGIGSDANNEILGFTKGLGRGLTKEITGAANQVAWGMAHAIVGAIGYSIGGIIFMIVMLSIVIPMLTYKVLKHYLTANPPSLASEISSSWYFFFGHRFSIQEIMEEIKASVLLNPKEIEAIALYLETLHVATMYNLPLPGLVFVGPPGTGKTKIARIIAKHFARYIFLSGSSFAKFDDGGGIAEMDRMFKWGKRRWRNFYTRSLVFIDEIEAFLSKRSTQTSSDRRLFTHFLSYTGLPQKDILIIGATNVPADIDPAARRRFAVWIEIKLPNKQNRSLILEQYLVQVINEGRFSLEAKINEKILLDLAEKLEGASGADIELVVREVNTRATIEGVLTLKMIEDSIETYLRKKKSTKQDYIAEPSHTSPARKTGAR